MKKLVVILVLFIMLMPQAPAFGQIVRPKKEQPASTPPSSQQSNRNTSQSTNKVNKPTTRTNQTGRTRTTNRTTRTRQSSSSRTRSSYNRSRVVRDDAPVFEVSFGCNVNGAVIVIDDEEYNVDDSCMLKEGSYLVEIEAEGYQDYSETIDVDEDNTYFYFELEEIPYDYSRTTEPLADDDDEEYYQPEEITDSIQLTQDIQDKPEEWVTVKGVTFAMVYVQGGTYTRYQLPDVADLHPGSVPPAHRVTLSGYYIGKNEVTRELWYAVMADSVLKDHPKDPMSNVSWIDCQEFMNKLSNMTGKNFRLPTDAEWEFAARGGVKSNGYAFSGSNNIDEVAWYSSNSDMEFHEVGLKKPNELGIYDMTGSVWEWCSDWSWNWREDVDDRTPLVNPTGPETGKNRVARGGGLLTEDENCCVCRPDPTSVDTRSDELGFRLVLQ